MRIRLENRMSKCAQKCQNCTENVPFFMRSHALQGCKHAYSLLSLPVNDAQKNGRKRRISGWVLVVIACKWQPTNNCEIRQSNLPLILKRSWNFSTINQKPSPVCDKHGLRKKRKKHFKPQWQQLTSTNRTKCLGWSIKITIVSYPWNCIDFSLVMRDNVPPSLRLNFTGASFIAIAFHCKNPSKGKRDTVPPNKDSHLLQMRCRWFFDGSWCFLWNLIQ